MNERIHVKKPSSGFYDLEQIKSIPIVDVCTAFNLSVEKRGKDYWCKARSERTASTILHPENNTFYDFGSSTGGDVISFVSYVCNIEPASAISMLAERFQIPCINQHEGKNDNYISDWEFKQIGLYGDRATKNFVWDFDRTPVERMFELEEKYSMPMNELRVKHPKIYEQVLRQNALPYLYELRNQYYLDIRSSYRLTKEVGDTSLFNPENFAAQIKKIKMTETIFARACIGTTINFEPTVEYDPFKDLEKISAGLIKPSLGNTSRKQLLAAATEANTKLQYRTLPYSVYITSDIDKYDHTAFLKGETVVVGFLESEYDKFRSFFQKKSTRSGKQSLDDKIAAASKTAETTESGFEKSVHPER